MVLFLAYTGVRFGELAALRVGRLDLLRRRAVITESVTLVASRQVFGTPKSHERREVPIPPFLAAQLAEHVRSRRQEGLVFVGGRSGAPLRAPVFRQSAFAAAATAIGRPGLQPHELRHTAASLAIAAGADVKVVQQMPGHASAAMTLDQYGHLFGDRLDEVAERMAVARAAAVARGPFGRWRRCWPAGPVTALTSTFVVCPRQDSNLRTRLRRAVLYPLSYGGSGQGRSYQSPPLVPTAGLRVPAAVSRPAR